MLLHKEGLSEEWKEVRSLNGKKDLQPSILSHIKSHQYILSTKGNTDVTEKREEFSICN